MVGTDKVAFLEQWKYGVLVTRKRKDDPVMTEHSRLMMSHDISAIVHPMRPGSVLPSQIPDVTEQSMTNSFLGLSQGDQ